ncbi:hypothetical protein TRFO_00835 [Tritrichomonas foetus]|uniref:Uncharacterized protein n=1 Tax=Tritrichomonas foetus TaxID=1144522 RepID=A0A1J4L3C8_9EUKA|nr:hypothetical protein TRFO_00835 [Tritrichomonas foetus]|eukprot:OHT17584.1 hypothetical protein TRFO_00835 [Tritrichomonas foetus]
MSEEEAILDLSNFGDEEDLLGSDLPSFTNEEEDENSTPKSDQVASSNPLLESSIILSCNQLKNYEPIPNMSELVRFSSNSVIQQLGGQIQAFIKGDVERKYAKSHQLTLQKAICTLAYVLYKEASDNQQANQGNSEEIKKLQNQIENLRETNSKLNSKIKDLDEENKNLTELNGDLVNDKSSLESQLNDEAARLKSVLDEKDELSSETAKQIESLKDNNRKLKDKLNLSENTSSRLTQQLQDSQEENANKDVEISEIKRKCDSLRIKYDDVSTENKRLKVSLESKEAEKVDLELEISKLNNSLRDAQTSLNANSSDQVIKLREDNEKLLKTNGMLADLVAVQITDVSRLQEGQRWANEILQEQQELIKAYDVLLDKYHQDVQEFEQQSEGDRKLISSLNENVRRLEQDNQALQGNDSASKLAELKRMLEKRYGPNVDVVKTVEELMEGTTDTETLEKNQRLFDTLDKTLKFWDRIVKGNDIKNAIKPSVSSKNAIDNDFKNGLLTQIARLRIEATQSSQIEASKIPDKDSVGQLLDRLKDSDKDSEKECYYLIAAATTAAGTLRSCYERERAKYLDVLNNLAQIQDIVNFEGQLDELPNHIVDRLFAFKSFERNIQNIIDNDKYQMDDFLDVLKFVNDFIRNASNILNSVDTDLRDAIGGDDIEIHEIPYEASRYIAELQNSTVDAEKEQCLSRANEIEMSLNKARQEYEVRNQQLQDQLEIANKEKDSLNKLRNEKDAEIEQLRNDMKDKEDNEKEMKDKVQKWQEEIKEYKEVHDKLRNEIASLRKALNQKNDEFDKRLENYLVEERNLHSEDLKRQEDRSKAREAKIKEQLESICKKHKDLKTNYKKMHDEYERAFNKQKEGINKLKHENSELNAKIAKHSNSSASSKDSDRLRADVKKLETEKLILSSKLKQAQESVEKIKVSRDNYWMSQMTLKEAELNQKIADSTTEANDRYEGFLEHVINVLEPFLPVQQSINEETAIETLNAVIQRLNAAENAIFNNKNVSDSKNSSSKSSPNSKNANDIVQSKALIALQEWDRWGRDLFVNVTDGEVPCQSCKELRYVLGEMIVSSIANRKLIHRLESLRIQKKFLKMEHEEVEEEPLSFRHLLIVALTGVRMMRRIGYFPTHYESTPNRQQKTPTKSPKRTSGIFF